MPSTTYKYCTFMVIFMATTTHVFCTPTTNTLIFNNHIRYLDAELFDATNLTPTHRLAITNINLESNSINDVDVNAFATFPNLTVLKLRDNVLERFRAKADALQHLDLSNNFITDGEADLILQFPNLSGINLAVNDLRAVDWQLKDAPLTTLNLSDNILLETVVIASEKLEKLVLRDLFELHTLKLDAPALKELDLRGTSFYDVDVGLEDVCRMNTQQEFTIVYWKDDGEKANFDCKKQEDKKDFDEDKAVEQGREKKKMEDDDIVLTEEEYSRLRLSFYILAILALVLLQLNGVSFIFYLRKTSNECESFQ